MIVCRPAFSISAGELKTGTHEPREPMQCVPENDRLIEYLRIPPYEIAFLKILKLWYLQRRWVYQLPLKICYIIIPSSQGHGGTFCYFFTFDNSKNRMITKIYLHLFRLRSN